MSAAPASRIDRALDVLGVQSREGRGVALMTAHSFFMGCATVFFETAASATFLSRFSASYIPWVYIAAAAVNTLTGATYSRVQSRVSFAKLMKGTLWFLLVIVFAVRLGFALSGAAWVAFAGLVSYRTLSSLTDLEYWAVASRMYDVRQAKRLFGLIGTGEVVARIAGSFAIPVLVKLGGVSNLILLSAAALGSCLWLLGAVLRPIPNAQDAPQEISPNATARTAHAGVREIFASRYLLLVVGVAIMATLGKYFVDFAFLEQMSTVSQGEEHLATVLGIFSGLTQTLSLLTRLFVSRPLLQRFGIRMGVLVLPVLHTLCAVVTIAVGMFDAATGIVFWLVIANQGLYKTFKHPIDNASFKVLYQPLKPVQRLATQIAVEVIFSPVVVGVAGVIMLLFSAGIPYDPVLFSCLMLANFVGWVVLARAAGGAYAVKLLDTLRRRIEGNVTLPFDDATTLSVLHSRLQSPRPAEVCVALSLLEKAVAPDLIASLVACTSHRFPEVRHYALERLIELQPSAVLALREHITTDPAPSVRRAALKIVAASDRAGEDLTTHLRDPDDQVRRAAIALLFGLGTAETTAVATAAVEKLALSAHANDRVLAAKLAGEHELTTTVLSLLADAHVDVIRSALVAAGRLSSATGLDELLDYLVEPRFAQSAAVALASRGGAVLEPLEKIFHGGTSQTLLRRIVYVVRLVGGPDAISVLQRHWDFPDVVIRDRVLAALDRLGYIATGEDRDVVRLLVERDVANAAWILGALRDLEAVAALPDLCRALEAEVAGAARRVFHLLAFTHDRTAVARVAEHITDPTKEKRANAHEVLSMLLEARERELVLPLLEEATNETRRARLAKRFPQPEQDVDARLTQLVERTEGALRGWTRALAIRASIERGNTSVSERWKTSNDPLVREAALWALHHEGSATKHGANMLLIEKIITLKLVPMFANTSEELLAEIAGIVESVEVRAGENIFQKGERGDSMYIVVTGRVRVFDGATTLRILGENEIFGELALLDPEPRSASVDAVEDTRLFRLDGDTFSQLMAGSLEIVRGVLHVLCERLRRTSASAGLA